MGKLVRDKIPDIIRRDGREPVVTVLDEVSFREALLAKLLEESAELSEAPPAQVPEEIADVLEVLHALARVHGHCWSTRSARTTGPPSSYTCNGGVDLGVVNVSAQSGFNSSSSITWVVRKKTWLCGNSPLGWVDGASRIAEAHKY